MEAQGRASLAPVSPLRVVAYFAYFWLPLSLFLSLSKRVSRSKRVCKCVIACMLIKQNCVCLCLCFCVRVCVSLFLSLNQVCICVVCVKDIATLYVLLLYPSKNLFFLDKIPSLTFCTPVPKSPLLSLSLSEDWLHTSSSLLTHLFGLHSQIRLA